MRGRGVSLPGSGVGSVHSTERTLSAVSSVSHRNEPAQPASELNNDRHKAPLQLVESLLVSQWHRPRFSSSGNILSGLRLSHTSTSSMMSPSYGDTSHNWRCELLPCQHSMCGRGLRRAAVRVPGACCIDMLPDVPYACQGIEAGHLDTARCSFRPADKDRNTEYSYTTRVTVGYPWPCQLPIQTGVLSVNGPTFYFQAHIAVQKSRFE